MFIITGNNPYLRELILMRCRLLRQDGIDLFEAADRLIALENITMIKL